SSRIHPSVKRAATYAVRSCQTPSAIKNAGTDATALRCVEISAKSGGIFPVGHSSITHPQTHRRHSTRTTARAARCGWDRVVRTSLSTSSACVNGPPRTSENPVPDGGAVIARPRCFATLQRPACSAHAIPVRAEERAGGPLLARDASNRIGRERYRGRSDEDQ